MTKSACKDCPNTFELIPPADKEYTIPREKPQTDDYIERFYECEEGHKNTIYWEKEDEPTFMSTKKPKPEYHSRLDSHKSGFG